MKYYIQNSYVVLFMASLHKTTQIFKYIVWFLIGYLYPMETQSFCAAADLLFYTLWKLCPLQMSQIFGRYFRIWGKRVGYILVYRVTVLKGILETVIEISELIPIEVNINTVVYLLGIDRSPCWNYWLYYLKIITTGWPPVVLHSHQIWRISFVESSANEIEETDKHIWHEQKEEKD